MEALKACANQYRKRPVVIEAVQVTDATFDAPHPNPEHIPGVEYDPVLKCAWIKTLEGTVRANLGDYIIRGVKGELYPCKPDIFAATYEPVSNRAPNPGAKVEWEERNGGGWMARAGVFVADVTRFPRETLFRASICANDGLGAIIAGAGIVRVWEQDFPTANLARAECEKRLSLLVAATANGEG